MTELLLKHELEQNNVNTSIVTVAKSITISSGVWRYTAVGIIYWINSHRAWRMDIEQHPVHLQRWIHLHPLRQVSNRIWGKKSRYLAAIYNKIVEGSATKYTIINQV